MNRGQKRAQWHAQFRRAGQATKVTTDRSLTEATAGIGRRPSVSRPKPESISVRIEELVVRGFERGHSRCIADALQQQLTNLLITRGVPPGWTKASIAHMRGKPIRLAPGTRDSVLGEQVARALFEIGGTDRP